MSSLLSALNPVPTFPDYTGQYKVGSVEVEIPVTGLPSPSPAPDATISTVSFRIFYPCDPPRKASKPVYWISEPQHEYVSAYASFLGASLHIANLIAYIPRLLYHAKIPVIRNAPLLPATTRDKRWPVMVFSHGLGGSRNAYSHLVGSLASHGIVVIAPEHRDGSAPISFLRDSNGTRHRSVQYQKVSHTPSRETEQARDDQLKIRLWELGLVFGALQKIDKGEEITSFSEDGRHSKLATRLELPSFVSSLDVHRPGAVSWSGHSFGAATVVQFLKTIFYRPQGKYFPAPGSYEPLYTPAEDSAIVAQITPFSTICLLDLWAFPLRSSKTRWLWNKPLPCYADDGPGGSNILAVLSEAFFKWRGNLVNTKRAISAFPAEDFNRGDLQRPPHIFYPVTSAHLSQSDFGIMFPLLTKLAFKAQEPDRTLRLNVRAILETLRQNGAEIGDTSDADMETAEQAGHAFVNEKANDVANGGVNGHAKQQVNENNSCTMGQDYSILRTDGSVRSWIALSIAAEHSPGEAFNEKTAATADPSEAVMEG